MRSVIVTLVATAFMIGCVGGEEADTEQLVSDYGDLVAVATAPSGTQIVSALSTAGGDQLGQLTWDTATAELRWQSTLEDRTLTGPALSPSLELANDVARTMWIQDSDADIAFGCYCTDYCYDPCIYYALDWEGNAYCVDGITCCAITCD